MSIAKLIWQLFESVLGAMLAVMAFVFLYKFAVHEQIHDFHWFVITSLILIPKVGRK